MSLIGKLSEHDQQVVVTKTVVVMGIPAIVKCYPMVKDNPDHFKKRMDIKTSYDSRLAREEQSHG